MIDNCEENKYENIKDIKLAYSKFSKIERNKLKVKFKKDVFSDYLKDLGISIRDFENLKEKERKYYLIDRVREIMSNDLKDFNKKIKKKKNKKLIEKKLENKKYQKENNKKLFNWLKLKSKYPYLKKILTTRIIQLIGQNENNDILEKLINEFEDLKSKNNKYKLYEFKSNLIFHTNKSNNKTFTVFNNDPNFNKENYADTYKEINLIDYENKIMTNRLNSDKINEFAWNEKIEKEFDTKRSQTKNLFYKNVKSAKYYDCSWTQFINQFKNNDSQKDQREILIENYLDGHWLTTQDLRFLAYTSDSLNMFLDKNFYKKALKIIDKSVIEDIELKIAMKILEDYTFLKKELINKRNNYYKNLIKDKKKNITSKIVKIGTDINLYQQKKLHKIFKKKVMANNPLILKTHTHTNLQSLRENSKNFVKIFPKQSKHLTTRMTNVSTKLNFNPSKMLKTYSCGPISRLHYQPKSTQIKEKASIIIQKNLKTKYCKNLKAKLKEKKERKFMNSQKN